MLYMLIGINRVKEFFSKMWQREEKGQTLIEYALILALIVIIVIVAVTTLGTKANATYTNVKVNLP